VACIRRFLFSYLSYISLISQRIAIRRAQFLFGNKKRINRPDNRTAGIITIATHRAELANYIFVRREPIIRSERAFHRGEATGNGNDPERCEVSPGCRGDSGRSCLLSGGESRDVEASVYYGPGKRVAADGQMEIGRYIPRPRARLTRTLHKPLLFILSLMQLRDWILFARPPRVAPPYH